MQLVSVPALRDYFAPYRTAGDIVVTRSPKLKVLKITWLVETKPDFFVLLNQKATVFESDDDFQRDFSLGLLG